MGAVVLGVQPYEWMFTHCAFVCGWHVAGIMCMRKGLLNNSEMFRFRAAVLQGRRAQAVCEGTGVVLLTARILLCRGCHVSCSWQTGLSSFARQCIRELSCACWCYVVLKLLSLISAFPGVLR
jgi:hypothetical protein